MMPDEQDEIGAKPRCQCTSFSINTKTNQCRVCDHEVHHDRIRCGAPS